MEGFLYIAGPYRGPRGTHDHSEYFAVDANINKAREWAAKFARAGIPFFCPHTNSAHCEVITPDVPADFWLAMDLNILVSARALFLIPDWTLSAGALAEHRFAAEHRIPTFFYDGFDALLQWWKEEPSDD
jgi:hypothetical protein